MPRNKKRSQKQPSRQSVRHVEAKTENQLDYLKAIEEGKVIFCSGPSGSGKSFIAAGMAAKMLEMGEIEQIVITRPLVCSGREIGSLPGELSEKIAPYLQPMEENLKFFLSPPHYGQYFNTGKIQYKPLEMMRGATFHSSVMILDEAQNCTVDQIKMFITRMGQGSKVLINGDSKQTDIRSHSGLEVVMDRLYDIKGVEVCELTHDDIQRNGILGDILRALED